MNADKYCNIYYDYLPRLFAAGDVPLETQPLTRWLYQLYQEKDQNLEKFNKTGRFPICPGNVKSAHYVTDPRKLNPNNPLMIASHIIVPILFIFEMYLLCKFMIVILYLITWNILLFL